jgi:hypothetical protein
MPDGARREIPNDASLDGASAAPELRRLTISQIDGIVAGPFGVVDHVARR